MTQAERVILKKIKGADTHQEMIYGNSNNVQPRSFVSCFILQAVQAAPGAEL